MRNSRFFMDIVSFHHQKAARQQSKQVDKFKYPRPVVQSNKDILRISSTELGQGGRRGDRSVGSFAMDSYEDRNCAGIDPG